MVERQEPTKKIWRIGELAEETGLTVRTLHHYEQIGLLRPGRTDAKHRIFDLSDVDRLFKIIALKELGLSLEEIRRSLDRQSAHLGPILAELLGKVKRDVVRLMRMQRNLEHLQPLIDRDVGPELLIEAIEAMSRVEHHIACDHGQNETPEENEKKWRELGVQLRACMETGSVDTSQVYSVVRKIHNELLRFARGDQTVLNALATLRKSAPPQQLAGWDPPLFEFLDVALKHHMDKESVDD